MHWMTDTVQLVVLRCTYKCLICFCNCADNITYNMRTLQFQLYTGRPIYICYITIFALCLYVYVDLIMSCRDTCTKH